ncbi:MAG: hypothetical protein KKH01_07195 [Firmicutes bacterium]|nr:hypothetical protein [Bacillota bacterium]
MEKLRIQDHLSHIETFGEEAMSANLECTCGNHLFSIKHTGKQTKGILSSHLAKLDNQLIIQAVCKICKEEIIIYDSNTDGTHQYRSLNAHLEFADFQLSKYKSTYFQIRMMYNYFPFKMKENNLFTNEFEMILIDISNEEIRKTLRLYED